MFFNKKKVREEELLRLQAETSQLKKVNEELGKVLEQSQKQMDGLDIEVRLRLAAEWCKGHPKVSLMALYNFVMFNRDRELYAPPSSPPSTFRREEGIDRRKGKLKTRQYNNTNYDDEIIGDVSLED